ncbi:MAG TPA: ammonia channel protein, partial [Polyangia bacterium]
MRSLKRWAAAFAFAVGSLISVSSGSALAQEGAAPAAAATPSISDLAAKVALVEAYINNADPKAGYTAGPGHNGFLMICAALVLFMTLPGLALFYGGLVRKKNILSVVAQCFGCAGLVTILWWAVGYSFVFAPGTPFLGGLDFAFFNGVTSAPNTNY